MFLCLPLLPLDQHATLPLDQHATRMTIEAPRWSDKPHRRVGLLELGAAASVGAGLLGQSLTTEAAASSLSGTRARMWFYVPAYTHTLK